jgi:methylated-DNA-protein-cysteine methyltransferase-like protein
VLRALETGEVLSGAEGDLKWIPKDEIMDLNLWEGDRLFLKMVAEDEPFFFMRLEYHGDDLVESHVGGESFKERVYEETARVPRGAVSTYGEIAVMAGHPGAARAVGNALHDNPYEGVIPCHRVVNVSGRPAANFGFGGPEEQLRLLREEGVEIRDGCVVFR